jgi:hypothetical protein
MDFNKLFQSLWFKIVLGIIFALILFFLGFKAGMLVGFRKADFSYKWGENYHRNFGGPQKGLWGNLNGDDFMSANGTFGQILKISDNILTIKDRSNTEKSILVDDKTAIREFNQDLKISDLKVDANIVVIGEPNEQGQINAKLIRVLPAQDQLPPNGQPLPPLPR